MEEADRILTLFTPSYRQAQGDCQRYSATKSRLGAASSPGRTPCRPGSRSTFDVVTQVQVSHAWLRLRDSLESTATAWYFAELADRALEERHEAEGLYALLRRSYELLDGGMDTGRVARWYEMHLADELGVRPEVDRCVECDRVLEADEEFRWVPPLGGVLCSRCPGPPAERAGLSLEASSCSRPISVWTWRPWPACDCLRLWNGKWSTPCATSCESRWSGTPGRWSSSTKVRRARFPRPRFQEFGLAALLMDGPKHSPRR